jgi:hypothetical protein
MDTAGTIRLAPTVREMGTILHTWTVAIPFCSIAFVIVAPQRVSVPQVDVRMTASTPAPLNSSPIALPNRVALDTAVVFPTVE